MKNTLIGLMIGVAIGFSIARMTMPRSSQEDIWLARYEIQSADGQAPWILLSPIMPMQTEKGWGELHRRYGENLKYTGSYLVGHASRQTGDRVTIKQK